MPPPGWLASPFAVFLSGAPLMPFVTAHARNAALSRPVDTCYTLETPEGVELALRPAGPLPRALAYGIDLALRGALLGGLLVLLGGLGGVGLGLGALLLFVVDWWYMVLFEVLHQGRTPGKQLMGLRVVHDDATPIGWTASLIRNLLRAVDMLPAGYAVGLFCCLQHTQFKRLGDLAAGTLVIYRDRPAPSATLPDADAAAAPWPLQLAEQQAIISLAERHRQLPAHRSRELAALLAGPLGVPPDQALARVCAIARHLQDSP